MNDTVHLSSSPRTCSGEEGKRVCFNLNFLPATLSPGAHRPDTMVDHPPRTCKKTEEGGPSLGSRAQWPTGRLLPMLHSESHSLGSINNNQHSSNGGEEKRGTEEKKKREKQRREEENEKKPKERERGEEEERTERMENRGKENQRRRRRGKETEEKERGRILLSAA